jgi:predicted transglutaminase-like cysteine proteinase
MFRLKVLLISSLLFTIVYADAPYVEDSLIEEINNKYNLYAKKRFELLQDTLDALKYKTDLEKLEGVNDFFNEVRYSSDIKTYGKSDYWATPWEFLGRDKGDCEDYVISKYFALKYLGVDYKKLFFTYVRSTKFEAPHMVLTYFETPKSEPLVLDNYNRKIFPASQRKDLIPIYNFNGDILDEADKKNEKSHKKWDELKLNMQRKKI